MMLNEVAPRPHNSGHYTIDGCCTSQFEQHIRAVLGWSLGDASLTVLPAKMAISHLAFQVQSAIMLNLLGEDEGAEGLRKAQAVIHQALDVPGACIHWYEKSKVSRNRKVNTSINCGSRWQFRDCLDRTYQPDWIQQRTDTATSQATEPRRI